MNLLNFLKRERLTLAEFGDRVGVKHSAVSRWTTGARVPPMKMIAKIDAATGGAVTVADWYAVEKAKADGEAA